MLPVHCLAIPVIIEPVNPERLPTELIKAMPAAAAEPERIWPGKVQKIGINPKIEQVATVRKKIDSGMLLEKYALRIRPTPPMHAGIAA